MLHRNFENEVDLKPVRLNAVFGEFYIHRAVGKEMSQPAGKIINSYNKGSSYWILHDDKNNGHDVPEPDWEILKYRLDNDVIEIRREGEEEELQEDENNPHDDASSASIKDNSIKFSFSENVTPYSFLLADSSQGIMKAFLSEISKESSPQGKEWYQHEGWTVCLTEDKIKMIETACVIETIKFRLKTSYVDEENDSNREGDKDDKMIMVLEWSPCVIAVNNQSLVKSIMMGQNPLNLCGKQILYSQKIVNNSHIEHVKKMAAERCQVFTIQSVKRKEMPKKEPIANSKKLKQQQKSKPQSTPDNSQDSDDSSSNHSSDSSESIDSSEEEDSNSLNEYIVLTTSGKQVYLSNCWEILPPYAHSPALQVASQQSLHAMRIHLNSPQQLNERVYVPRMLILQFNLKEKFQLNVQPTMNMSASKRFALPSPVLLFGGGHIFYPSSQPIREYEKYETKLLKEIAKQLLQKEWTHKHTNNLPQIGDLSYIQNNDSSFSQTNYPQEQSFQTTSEYYNDNETVISDQHQGNDDSDEDYEKSFKTTMQKMNLLPYPINAQFIKESTEHQLPNDLIESILGLPSTQRHRNQQINSNTLNGWQQPRQSNNTSRNSLPVTAATSAGISQMSKRTQSSQQQQSRNVFDILDRSAITDASMISQQHTSTKKDSTIKNSNNNHSNKDKRSLNDRTSYNSSNNNNNDNNIHNNSQANLPSKQIYQLLSHQYFGLSSPHTLASHFIMDNWAIVYQEQERELIFGYIQLLKTFSTTVGIQFFNPLEIIIPKSCKNNDNWMTAIKKCIAMYNNLELKLLVSVFPQGCDQFDFSKINYLLQRFCAFEQQCVLLHFPSQELFPLLNLPNKDNNKNNNSMMIQEDQHQSAVAARKVLQNLLLTAAKCNAPLWITIQNHSQNPGNLMILGITQTIVLLDQDSPMKNVLSVVSSTNDKLSEFFSQSIFDEEEKEKSPFEIAIKTAIKEKQKMKNFRNNNNNRQSYQPLTVVIFRDYQVPLYEGNTKLKDQEIEILENLHKENELRFLLINVETNVLECLFPQKSVVLIENEKQFNTEEEKILPDFYICADDLSFTRYKCLVNHSDFSLSEIVSLAHSQCFNCFLPVSPIAHPGIMEYSRRLSQFTVEILKCEVPERLSKTLFFI